MNRITLALLFGAAALAASSARADTRVRIGVNVGSPDYYPPAPVVVAARPPTVVYAPAPSVAYAPPPTVVVAPPPGYWKEVQVKTWVPERWLVRSNRWGRTERYCEPGYFTYRTERVWVDSRSDHGRGYGYGQDHSRYDNRGYGYNEYRR